MHTHTNDGEKRAAEPLPANDTDAPNRPRSSKAATACAWLAPLAVLLMSAVRAIADSYPFELLCHFQVQYFIASIAILLLLVTLRRRRAVIVAGAALIVSGSALAPLWIASPSNGARTMNDSASGRLRILHANVLSSNEQHAPLLDLIAREQPDLLALHEINARWIEALAVLADDYPYRTGSQREDDFGILVLSRTPLRDATVQRFGSSQVPSVTFQIRVHDVTLQFVAAHTMPPMSVAAQSARDEHLTQMAAFAKTRSGPLIIVGDLNTTMWSPSYRRLCDELGLTNTRRGFGILPTWPASLPTVMRLPIDHCLVGSGITVLDCRLGPNIGSDHLPLIIDLAVGARSD